MLFIIFDWKAEELSRIELTRNIIIRMKTDYRGKWPVHNGPASDIYIYIFPMIEMLFQSHRVEYDGLKWRVYKSCDQ